MEWFSLGLEHRTLGEVIRQLEDPANPYVASSRYAGQLDEYRRFFASSQLLVIDQHELLQRRAATMATAFEFLDVDPSFTSPEFTRVLNPREGKWRLNASGGGWSGAAAPTWCDGWKRSRGRCARSGSASSRGAPSRPSFRPDTRAAIAEALRPDAERLRDDDRRSRSQAGRSRAARRFGWELRNASRLDDALGVLPAGLPDVAAVIRGAARGGSRSGAAGDRVPT